MSAADSCSIEDAGCFEGGRVTGNSSVIKSGGVDRDHLDEYGGRVRCSCSH